MNVGEDNVANMPLKAWRDISQLTSFQGYKAKLTLLRLALKYSYYFLKYDTPQSYVHIINTIRNA